MTTDGSAHEAAARRGAAHVLEADPQPFAPARMSKHARWFQDETAGTLVVIGTPDVKDTVADEILAYALAWQENRDLILLMPRNMVLATLTRLSWVDTAVQLFEYDGEPGETPNPVRIQGRFTMFSYLRDLPLRVPKRGVLKDAHEQWIDGIDISALTAHDRGGYLSWHHDGLQVLRVSETKTGLRIRAGVGYTKPPAGREVFDKTFKQPPSPCEMAVINAKVALAIEDGGSLTSRMREHKMQAILNGQPDALGLTHLWREFPAWRGMRDSSPTYEANGRPGFIDFLGADANGVLHVVETKIGHDPKVVLQALDYAIWVKANDELIREQLKKQGHVIPTPSVNRSTDTRPAPIHLVLGADMSARGDGAGRAVKSVPAFNSYLASQIEAIDGDCKVRVYLTAEPTASPLVLTRLSTRGMWEPTALVAKPVVGPRWPHRLSAELAGLDA